MENITDKKKGKSIEQEQMPYAGVVTFGNIFERAALGKDLTQSGFQPFTQMIRPIFGFSQLKESNEKMSSSAKDI
jgi:hypothetical protein